jgi:cytochrome c7-like protein
MRPFLIALLVAFATLAMSRDAAGQNAPKPPANDDCLACHGDAEAKRASGSSVAVDAKTFSSSIHGDLACVDCHADLQSLQEYPHADRLKPVDCGTCHTDEAVQYHPSAHGRAREAAGLIVAPTCATCHGTHDIKPGSEATSRTAKRNIATNCGTCHTGIKERYDVGIHAAAIRKGNLQAPTCTNCHTAHAISRTDNNAWRLNAMNECGGCHTRLVETYTRTFHGKVTQLGFGQVAACADCHRGHDILPPTDAASSVAPAHRLETCSKCHKGANTQFVKYDPHPDPTNYDRDPVLWYANVFYWVLIPGCFGFFALHSALWFNRSWRERRK